MSQSPTAQQHSTQEKYLEAFNQLALKIRDGQSFSGRERDNLFLNTGGLRFTDIAAAASVDMPEDGRGLVLTDWDGDGALDILMSNRNAPRVRFLRNGMASNGHWLSVRLTGDPAKRTPRDAIGARVVVQRKGQPPLTQTLGAGDAFLSQGSKTLHFGLGLAKPEIESITVRWPGGGRDTFTGITPDAVWWLQQGGKGERLNIPKVELKPSALVLPESGDSMRIRLSQPLKLPPLAWTDLDGKPQTMESLTANGPVLINLWATWCAPCAAELKDFQSLPAGLTLLPICVDNLDGKSQTTAEQARAFLTKTGHKGAAGWASAETVQTLDRLLREAVYRHLRMPVPASFLVDKGGWLTVIYKGNVEPARIAEDLKNIAVTEDRARELAVPFPGPWAGRTAFVSHLPAVVAAWREAGDVVAARETLEVFLKENPPRPGDARLASQISDVHFRLGDLALEAGESASALEQFNAALAASSQLIPAQIGRLRALSAMGQEQPLADAVRLLGSSPAAADALAVMAEHHRRAGKWKEAIMDLRQAVLRNQRFVPGLNDLARLLAAAPDESARNPGEALSLANFFLAAPGARQNPEFLLTLAAAQAAKGDFPAAIVTAQSAMEIARVKADREFLRRAAPVLEGFKTGQAWLLARQQ